MRGGCEWRGGGAEGKGENGVMRVAVPARSTARCASFAKDGPIFPPAPKMTISPLRPRMNAMSASLGRVSRSVNSAMLVIMFLVIPNRTPGQERQIDIPNFQGTCSRRDTCGRTYVLLRS